MVFLFSVQTNRIIITYFYNLFNMVSNILMNGYNNKMVIYTDGLRPNGISLKNKPLKSNDIYTFNFTDYPNYEILIYFHKNKCYDIKMNKICDNGKIVEYVCNTKYDENIMIPFNEKCPIVLKFKSKLVEFDKTILNESSDGINKIFLDGIIIDYCLKHVI